MSNMQIIDQNKLQISSVNQTLNLKKLIDQTFKKGVSIVIPNAVMHSLDKDTEILEMKLFLGIWQSV